MYGGAAGYRPRVRSVYYERVYVHSPERQFHSTLVFGNIKGLLRHRFCLWWYGGCLSLTQTYIYGVFLLANGTDAPFSDGQVLGCAEAIPNLAVWSWAGVIEP